MGNDLSYITTHMSHRITRQDLQITIDQINESFKAEWPNAATLTLIRYQGRGYEVRMIGQNNYNEPFPHFRFRPMILKTREMSIFLDGILAGFSL